MQGTTTNGEYLLPFKTGAFLAGAPVQPVVLKYGKASLFWSKHYCCILGHGLLFLTDTVNVQGGVSPAWESISAPRHLFLMFAGLCHCVTAYEVRMGCACAIHSNNLSSQWVLTVCTGCSFQCTPQMKRSAKMLCYMQPMSVTTW